MNIEIDYKQAREILYKTKVKHNIGNVWQLTEHIILNAMETYAQQQVKNCVVFNKGYLGEQVCQHSENIEPRCCIYDCTDCPYTNKMMTNIT